MSGGVRPGASGAGCRMSAHAVAVYISRKTIYICSTCYDVIMRFKKVHKKDIINEKNTKSKL